MKNILRNITGITAGELNKIIGELYALTVGFKNISNPTEQTPNDIKCIVKRVIDNYKTTVELEAFKGFIYGLQDNPENFNVLIDHFTDMTGEDYLINVKIPAGETYAPCSPIHKAHIEAQDAIQPLKKITKIELTHKPAVVAARAKVDDVYSIDAQAIITDLDVLEAAELAIKNIETKFDVTADWASAGVTDEQSFISFLETQYGGGNAFINVMVNGFSLNNGRLECSLVAEGSMFILSNIGITEAISFGDINGLTGLNLTGNQIVDFNPSIALPTSLISLYLGNNQIAEFNPSIALPTSLISLYLDNNQIAEFNPSIALPTSLISLYLGNNQIAEFNPSIALPTSLIELYLGNNQIAEFNPSIALPTSLIELHLGNNQIAEFNPSIALPTSLIELSLDYNQIAEFNPSIALPTSLIYVDLAGNNMNVSGYEESEYWANNQPSFVNACTFRFEGNPDSITGSNLEQILLTKNVVIS